VLTAIGRSRLATKTWNRLRQDFTDTPAPFIRRPKADFERTYGDRAEHRAFLICPVVVPRP
jgi:hypothetical protein